MGRKIRALFDQKYLKLLKLLQIYKYGLDPVYNTLNLRI